MAGRMTRTTNIPDFCTSINLRLNPRIKSIALHYQVRSKVTPEKFSTRGSQYKATTTMSLHGKHNKLLAALTAVGVLVAANYYIKPSVPLTVALRMNRELSEYNATPHPEQDRW